MMKLKIWAYHFGIADGSVVSLSYTASFLVLHSLPFPCFVPSPPSPPGFCRVQTV